MTDKLPDVKLNFVVGGVDAAQHALQSIVQTAERTNMRYKQSSENTNRKIIELERQKSEELKRIAENDINKRLNIEKKYQQKALELSNGLARQKVMLEERTQLQMDHIYQRSAARRQQAQSQNWRTLGQAAAGSVGGLSGYFNVGAGQAASGLTGGGIGGALAGGAVIASLVAIKEAFEVVTSGARAFGQAIMELSGGFSVSSSIVKAAKADRAAVEISGSIYDKDQSISSAEVKNIINAASLNSEFSREEVGKAMRAYVGKTGNAREFGKNSGFLTKVASVTGTSLDETSERFGNLRSQFSTLSDKELQELTTRMIAQGAKGTVEFRDAASVGRITGAAGQYAGDKVSNIAKQFALAQLVTPGAGSVEEGVTQISSLGTAISHLQQKGLSKKYGIEYQNTPEGKKIANQDKIIESMVLAYKKDPLSFKTDVKDIRAQRAIENISEKVTGSTDEERKASFKELMKSFSDANLTIEQLDDRLKELSNTSEYSLKKSFNNISTQLGEAFLPYLKKFAETLSENIPNIVNMIPKFVTVTQVLISGLVSLAEFISSLMPEVTPEKIKAAEDKLSAMYGRDGTDSQGAGSSPEQIAAQKNEIESMKSQLHLQQKLLEMTDPTLLANAAKREQDEADIKKGNETEASAKNRTGPLTKEEFDIIKKRDDLTGTKDNSIINYNKLMDKQVSSTETNTKIVEANTKALNANTSAIVNFDPGKKKVNDTHVSGLNIHNILAEAYN